MSPTDHSTTTNAKTEGVRPDIGIYISSMRGGGAERVMRDLANAFVGRGLSTDLLLARGEGPYLGDVDARVRIVDFGVKRPLLSMWPLVRYLRRERPRAVLSALTHTNLIAVAARRISRVPTHLVVSQRNDPSVRPRFLHEPWEILNFWMLGFGYRRADMVIAVSEGVARALEEVHSVPRSLIRVIYNGVSIPTEAPRQTSVHPWLDNTGSIPVLVAAGRLSYQKGFDTLIRALRRIRNDRPARLIILGEGEEQARLESLAHQLEVSDDLLFPGFVAEPWAWIRRASVFTLSSRWEGLPGVLLQAMACGTAVVSTDCPSGPSEILEGGRWGRLVGVDDPEALAQAILETLDDPNPPPVVERARDFDPSGMVDEYLDALDIGGESSIDTQAQTDQSES